MKTLPHHLAQNAATGLTLNEPVSQYEIGNYQNFVYLIVDWKNKVAVIVDPQKNLAPLLEDLQKHNIILEEIFLTHTHHDHIAGVPELLELFPKMKATVHEHDQHRLNTRIAPPHRVRNIQEGDTLRVGEIEVSVLHTPGHSAGECSYYIAPPVGPYLFTGDTVFIRDCGRTDFDTGSNSEMFASLQKIKGLPQETIFLPGHHYQKECATTLERELLESPPFKCHSVEELASLP